MSEIDSKILLIGCLASEIDYSIGAVIKTREIYKTLGSIYGKDNVICIDTYNWKKKIMRIFVNIIKNFSRCSNVIVISSVSQFLRLNVLLKVLGYIYDKEYEFILVGGSFANRISRNKRKINNLNKINRILVESDSIKISLEKIGIYNVDVMTNFKNLKILHKEEIIEWGEKYPMKFCTFSRVCEEKGILDAISVINKVNENNNKVVATLDIYGRIEPFFEEEFRKVLSKNIGTIAYRGVIEYDKSVDVLKKYYMLLFPTKFSGEGIPGTVIDALSSGLPVLSSKWRYYNDILREGFDSVSFVYGDLEDFYRVLNYCIFNFTDIDSMRINCIESAQKYDSKKMIKVLIECWK